jgi:hypothetical protein
MRNILLLTAAAAMASCTTAPQPTTRSAEGQQQFNMLLAGKVAQPQVSCVPPLRMNDMKIIDEDTIAFRDGPAHVYVATTSGCSNLRPNGSYALVTKQYGGFGLCRGDISQVRDLASGMVVGSCSITSVTPFVIPGR